MGITPEERRNSAVIEFDGSEYSCRLYPDDETQCYYVEALNNSIRR